MSQEYRYENRARLEQHLDKLLRTAPDYIRNFYDHMHNGKREINTQSAYIRDIIAYLQYLHDTVPDFAELPLTAVPISVFDQLNVKDLNEYRAYLSETVKISNSSVKKKFAAISAFYKYIIAEGVTQNNPMTNFELPAVNKHRIVKLDSSMSARLLEGILRNDRYLADTPDGKKVFPIEEAVFIKREPLVLRNYAICCLFLGAGLRVSELVGLDLSDINFTQSSLNIIAKGGDEVQVYFGEEVAKALHTYLDGAPLPEDLLRRFSPEEQDWCRENINDPGFREKMKVQFPDRADSFYRDLAMLTASMRRQGRNGLRPVKGCRAVFISSRGSRMSVRMVELMIKEMVRTYLPDYDDKDIFSPHKLRATCATRILTQTGDIQLASTQLNHKGIQVTAAFYAELQKEKQKEKIRNLNLDEW